MNEISQCKNRLGERCKLNGGVCNHLVYDGRCDNANVDTLKKVTFEYALELLLKTTTNRDKCTTYKTYYNMIYKNSKFKPSDNIEDFIYEEAEIFCKSAENKNYSSHTIRSVLNAIYVMGNVKFRTIYKSNGFKNPLFEKYPYKAKKCPKTELSWKQLNEIKFKMEQLRRNALDNTLGNKLRTMNRNYFIAMWWGYHFGTRTGDINLMKWSNIVFINGIPHVKWIPHKTMHSSNCEVCWPISDEAYNQIKEFIGKESESCLILEEKYIPKKNKRINKATHYYMWKKLNKFFRSIGIEGWGGFYSLRYNQSQQTYKHFGEFAESMKLGHSINEGQMSYYNKNNHCMTN